MTKLLVNYMASHTAAQQHEILEVMARILQFDETIKQQVGLVKPTG